MLRMPTKYIDEQFRQGQSPSKNRRTRRMEIVAEWSKIGGATPGKLPLIKRGRVKDDRSGANCRPIGASICGRGMARPLSPGSIERCDSGDRGSPQDSGCSYDLG